MSMAAVAAVAAVVAAAVAVVAVAMAAVAAVVVRFGSGSSLGALDGIGCLKVTKKWF